MRDAPPPDATRSSAPLLSRSAAISRWLPADAPVRPSQRATSRGCPRLARTRRAPDAAGRIERHDVASRHPRRYRRRSRATTFARRGRPSARTNAPAWRLVKTCRRARLHRGTPRPDPRRDRDRPRQSRARARRPRTAAASASVPSPLFLRTTGGPRSRPTRDRCRRPSRRRPARFRQLAESSASPVTPGRHVANVPSWLCSNRRTAVPTPSAMSVRKSWFQSSAAMLSRVDRTPIADRCGQSRWVAPPTNRSAARFAPTMAGVAVGRQRKRRHRGDDPHHRREAPS